MRNLIDQFLTHAAQRGRPDPREGARLSRLLLTHAMQRMNTLHVAHGAPLEDLDTVAVAGLLEYVAMLEPWMPGLLAGLKDQLRVHRDQLAINSKRKAELQAKADLDPDPGRAVGAASRRHGPEPKVDEHRKVKAVVDDYGARWAEDANLKAIAERLDKDGVPSPDAWRKKDLRADNWVEGLDLYKSDFKKVITYKLKHATPKSAR